ncbi:MAG: uracil-DNA glycosylase [Euryarchaeota archaeon]|nr:uracil-DNA glycosylase [Euryarchaeota archaeon]
MMPERECRLCGLCVGRTNIVYPDGDPDAAIVFVGEAPGESEDLAGRPFVGRSGKLLDAILTEGGLNRSTVLITNAVKCRPPQNRDPTESEMEACRPFLRQELNGRKVVVGLGRSSCRTLIGYEGRMADIVNVPQRLELGETVSAFIPAYHPEACIYNPGLRDSLRETVRLAKELAEGMR